jgi:hypothetical protein
MGLNRGCISTLAAAALTFWSAISPAAPPSTTDTVLPDQAGVYLAWRVATGTAGTHSIPPQVASQMSAVKEMFRVDLMDAGVVDALGVDRERSILAAGGIVEPAALEKWLASSYGEVRARPLVVRMSLVVPVTDVEKARAAAEKMATGVNCGHPHGDATRWSAWLKHLPTEAERKAATSAAVLYLCRTNPLGTIAARLDRDRRELQWVRADTALGGVAAAVGPVLSASGLTGQLNAQGFFAARAAMYATPLGQTRLIMANDSFRLVGGLEGVDVSMREEIWRSSMQELGAANRLMESAPRLFSDFLVTDQVMTWGLTKAGESFFSSLDLPAGASVRQLRAETERKLKLEGLFARETKLTEALREAPPTVEPLLSMFLWPHLLAFAHAHPGGPIGPALRASLQEGTVDLDRKGSRLRIRTK